MQRYKKIIELWEKRQNRFGNDNYSLGIDNFNLQNDSTFASENEDKKVFNKWLRNQAIKAKNIKKERRKKENDAELWCQWQKKRAAEQKGQDSGQAVLRRYRGGDNRNRHTGNNTDKVSLIKYCTTLKI